MSAEAICEFDHCEKRAETRVRSVTGVEALCATHAWIVRQVNDYTEPKGIFG